MEAEHKELLRKNRVKIVDELENVDDILDELVGPGDVFTDGMKEEIEAKGMRRAKVQKLLDILPRRGPAAFGKFCAALWPANSHLAQLLDPQGQYRDGATLSPDIAQVTMVTGASSAVLAPDSTSPLPEKWPNENIDMDSVVVKRSDLYGDLVRRKFVSDTVYPVAKSPRGRVLVINNETFSEEAHAKKLFNRKGTQKDRQNIEKLFKELHFDVSIEDDASVQAISSAIDEECRDTFHNTADCFVMVIMTHGDIEDNVDVIYGVDGNSVKVKDQILQKFEDCEYLRDKPKVFLFQACRGTGMDPGKSVSYSTLPTEKESGFIAENLSEEFGRLNISRDSTKGDTVADAKGEKTPSKADFLIATATTAGTVSWRNTVSGSWFIQAIVYIFQRYAHEEDIESMLRMVNNLVSRGVAKVHREEFVTVSEYRSTLRKSLYFFPGIIKS